MKRLSLSLILVLALGAAGCGLFHSHKASTASPAAGAKPIVTSDASLSATIVAVNPVGRFVVLSFSGLQMPKVGQSFFIYRSGLKVAEVKITGPRQDENIVADLLSGDAQVGDAVRDE